MAVGPGGLHRRQVVVRDADEALHQGLEAGLDLAIAGGGEGRQGAAVEAVLHDQDGGLLDPPLVTVKPGQLDGGLVGLGPGVAEEDPVHARQGGQAGPKLGLGGDLVEIGGMHQATRLIAEGLPHRGMGMAQAADGDARQGVEIAFTGLVPQPGARAVGEGDRQAPVGRHQGIAHSSSRSMHQQYK